MNSNRIKEIQMATAFPESVSVQQALLQVWNECEQDKSNSFLPTLESILFSQLPAQEKINKIISLVNETK